MPSDVPDIFAQEGSFVVHHEAVAVVASREVQMIDDFMLKGTVGGSRISGIAVVMYEKNKMSRKSIHFDACYLAKRRIQKPIRNAAMWSSPRVIDVLKCLQPVIIRRQQGRDA